MSIDSIAVLNVRNLRAFIRAQAANFEKKKNFDSSSREEAAYTSEAPTTHAAWRVAPSHRPECSSHLPERAQVHFQEIRRSLVAQAGVDKVRDYDRAQSLAVGVTVMQKFSSERPLSEILVKSIPMVTYVSVKRGISTGDENGPDGLCVVEEDKFASRRRGDFHREPASRDVTESFARRFSSTSLETWQRRGKDLTPFCTSFWRVLSQSKSISSAPMSGQSLGYT